MIFPPHVLEAIAQKWYRHPTTGELVKGQHDGPRAMMAYALEGRFEDQPHRVRAHQPQTTDNHDGQAEAAFLYATRCAEPHLSWMVDWLGNRWRVEGECLGEQTPSTYDKHHASHLAVTIAAAKRDGKGELHRIAVDALRRWVALRVMCMAPADAHPDIANRTVLPGRRCGDHLGMSAERDVILHLLLRRPPPRSIRWPIHQPEKMELHAVAHLRSMLPDFPATGELPNLADPMHFQRYEHGHAAWTPVSTMKTGRGGSILWAVVADYRTGKVQSVSWKDPMGLPYNDQEARATGNPRRPVARQMGGGPMPAPLPSTARLGAKVGPEIVVGAGGGSQPGPQPPAPQPPQPKPPEPPVEPPAPEPPVGPQRYVVDAENVNTGAQVGLLIGNDKKGALTIFREVARIVEEPR